MKKPQDQSRLPRGHGSGFKCQSPQRRHTKKEKKLSKKQIKSLGTDSKEWLTSIKPAFRRVRQEDSCKFEISLDYPVSSRLVYDIDRDLVSGRGRGREGRGLRMGGEVRGRKRREQEGKRKGKRKGRQTDREGRNEDTQDAQGMTTDRKTSTVISHEINR